MVLSGRCLHVNNVEMPAAIPATNPSDFYLQYPSKSVSELLQSPESGVSVVRAKIVGCFQVNQWWYPICDCGKCMEVLNGLYQCADCKCTTFNVKSK